MLTIRYEMPSDHSAIETLLDRCFGKDRRNKISYRYRDGVDRIHELCLVAEMQDVVVGTIRYWPILCGGQSALLLGPLGIDPERHGQGIGRTLVNRTLSAAGGGDVSLVFLVGDPGYYTRFQFACTPPNIVMPGERPLRLQYRLLGDGSLPLDQSVIERWPTRSTSLSELTGRIIKRSDEEGGDPVLRSRMIAELTAFT